MRRLMSELSTLSKVTAVLCIIGAINWGIIGLFNYNLVAAIFPPALERVIYVLVGLSGLSFIVSYLVPSLKHSHDHEHDMAHHL